MFNGGGGGGGGGEERRENIVYSFLNEFDDEDLRSQSKSIMVFIKGCC